jgi:fibro-slime domain-containing protein
VTLPIVYRDFKAKKGDTSQSHPDFGNVANPHALYQGAPGFTCTVLTNSATTGQVCDATHNTNCCGRLNALGNPALNDKGGTVTPFTNVQFTTGANFAQWYTDVTNVNINIPRTLQLDRQGTPGNYSYVYDSGVVGVRCGETIRNGGFYPLDFLTGCVASDTVGWGDQSGTNSHNYGFTSVLRYFFQYSGNEQLAFRGDDDVWVFINGRLAVDIGGVHNAVDGSVLLGDEDNNGVLSGTETSDATDDRFSISKGNIYEIVVFQAERNETESNYKLTLTNFILGRSSCTAICGDGVVQPGETCDDGTANNTGEYGHCNSTCSAKRFCGDTVLDPEEACDNGVNKDGYGAVSANKCAPGCVAPPYCGDGLPQTPFGEECDAGTAKNNGSYGGCTALCKLGPRCGDNTVQPEAGEICDKGTANGGYGAPSKCGYDCKPAPYCGDGTRQPPEACDEAEENNDLLYGGCKTTCVLGPRCGDGVKQSDQGEQCDNGIANNDLAYGGCKTTCQLGPRCGDGVRNGSEACDLGAQNKDGSYGGCQTNCTEGPKCGDGVTQTANGEVCDAGTNNGRYGFCAADCKSVIKCGDGIKNGTEQCDNGQANSNDAYNGCRTDCTLGVRCGDGIKNGTEDCDDGQNLGGYGQCAPGCKYGAHCGDGVVQSASGEQCDDGKNLGGYGECAPGCKLGPRCGDKIVQSGSGEQCDDGNSKNGDKCSNSCKTETWIIQ